MKSEGTIRREGNILVGEGEAGMEMFDDTMKLGISKTLKQGYTARTILATGISATLGFLAYKFDNLPLAAASGSIGTVAVQQGVEMVKAWKEYAHTLEEAVSHDWNSKEDLKKIDSRYIY